MQSEGVYQHFLLTFGSFYSSPRSLNDPAFIFLASRSERECIQILLLHVVCTDCGWNMDTVADDMNGSNVVEFLCGDNACDCVLIGVPAD